MNTAPRQPIRLVATLLAVLAGLLPVALYWATIGRVPTVTPEQARGILAEPGGNAVLVDVRPQDQYARDHIDAARNWPYEQIQALGSVDDMPEPLQGKRLLMLCDSGILSGLAAQRLAKLGFFHATNVRGGIQAWVGTGEAPCALGLCRLRTADGRVQDLPFRASPVWEQWTAIVTGFAVKPLYTVLALTIVVVLWRQRSPELVALRWALLCFFIGENFCAANYLLYKEQSILFEYLHSFGMVLCFSLVIYALMEGLDRHLIRQSDPEARCAALGLCRRCIKHADVPCGLQRLFLFVIPAVLIVSLMPICAPLVPVSYNTRILGTFYTYSHAVVHQVFESRYLPACAGALLAVSLAMLRFKRAAPVLWSKVFFCAGAGAIGFSFLRLVLLHAYRDNMVWFGAWEEITELLFVLGVAIVLWIFRDALLRNG